jgi:catecholate siderophore receptor
LQEPSNLRSYFAQTHSKGDTMQAHTTRPVVNKITLAVTLALLHMGAVHAQTTAPTATAAETAAAAGDGLQLDRIIVTGSTSKTSKMRSSVAISSVEGEGLVTSTAASATEILRSIPGLRSESSGGESNANVGVRGLPISAGGARYIQFQEDGLPVLQFGDIAFATADTWIRADSGLDRLEVLRGGSASTLATGSPGGIINYITKTGIDQGGSLAVTKGLGYDETRLDMNYGGRLAPKTRFWVGGFYHSGDGGRPGAAGTVGGGQIRANVTQELANGFVRLSLKHLDDRTPTFLPTPVRFVNGSIQEIDGLDPRKAAFFNAALPLDNTLTNTNGRAVTNVRDGLSAKTDALGVDADFDVGGGLRITNNFKWSKNSGRFVGIFPGSDVKAAPTGTTVQAGANAGSAYTGNWFQAVVFNTKVDDAGLVADDLKVSKSFELGDGNKLTATGGLYTSIQTLKLTWNFNQYSLSAVGDKAQLLNVPGADNANAVPAFGGCCSNFQDSTYKTTAPYISVGFDGGPFTADISLRRDNNSAAGAYYQTLTDFGGLGGGTQYNLAKPRIIDYDFTNTSYSLGGNYQLNKDFAVFGRASKGAAFNADRITFFNSAKLVDGSSSKIPVNEVTQLEGGVKYRGAGLSLFATLFFAKTDEINVDPTTTPVKVQTTKYDSKGLELEAAYRYDLFSISGGATFTDAKVKESSNAAIVGKTPKRQAKLVYQLTPSVNLGDAQIGASIVGTSSSKDDGPDGPVSITLPAYTAINLFANYAITPQATVSLAVNNATNTIGYTESNDGRGAARSINGRTAKLALKYTF